MLLSQLGSTLVGVSEFHVLGSNYGLSIDDSLFGGLSSKFDSLFYSLL